MKIGNFFICEGKGVFHCEGRKVLCSEGNKDFVL